MKTVIELSEKFDKNVALQSYFEPNSLFELQKITKRNNNKIRRKLNKLLEKYLSECEQKLDLLEQCVAHMKRFRTKYCICNIVFRED